MTDETKIHEYGDYIIYGDETGDHSMETVSAQHPVFALVFCIFEKERYITDVVKHFKKLKFTFWGHDATILHSAKLRKQIDDFQFLQNEKRRTLFLDSVSNAIRSSEFTIISTAIDKRLLKENYTRPDNPYLLSLEYCLERAYRFLIEKRQLRKTTHLILESRGHQVDHELDAAFNKIILKNTGWQTLCPLKLLFVDKKANCIGLQIADLIAYPIGRFVVDPLRENPAFNIFEDKFHKHPDHIGKGLKIFPLRQEMSSPQKTKASDFSEA